MKTKLIALAIGISVTGLVLWSKPQSVPVTQEAPTIDATGAQEAALCNQGSKTFSHHDFTGMDLSAVPTSTLSNLVICNSNFYQQAGPGTHIFPDNMTGVTFVASNLDNVFVPEGNAVVDSTRRKIEIQNDQEDWIVDDAGNPTEPVNKEQFKSLQLSTNPQDIPAQMLNESLTTKTMESR